MAADMQSACKERSSQRAPATLPPEVTSDLMTPHPVDRLTGSQFPCISLALHLSFNCSFFLQNGNFLMLMKVNCWYPQP